MAGAWLEQVFLRSAIRLFLTLVYINCILPANVRRLKRSLCDDDEQVWNALRTLLRIRDVARRRATLRCWFRKKIPTMLKSDSMFSARQSEQFCRLYVVVCLHEHAFKFAEILSVKQG